MILAEQTRKDRIQQDPLFKQQTSVEVMWQIHSYNKKYLKDRLPQALDGQGAVRESLFHVLPSEIVIDIASYILEDNVEDYEFFEGIR
eukprot:CAMPEP_0174268614 /NCGR_PEP_ID=MMETSP0439-20130205/38133_1 /TAXON_ID=0 /ORGANISM="Stereomyxa ramosa, Strain Chinc5" /LENGTH=87 /DNA_ID=CAMNT_0015356913 /DNA_START=503 /DNA_END=762 /DNA_ORIENTATION=-